MYCWQPLLRGVEAPDGTSAVALEVHETPWAAPVPAEERILPTAFPLSFENKFMENTHETILSSCLCLFILLSLCVEPLLGLIERTVTALEIGIR